MTKEIRKNYGDNVEIRTAEVRAAGDDMVLEGYASIFGVPYDIGFREVVDIGAFDNVLENDVRFLLNHDGAPLARTTNKTLDISVDDTGLHYRAKLADTTAGRDLYEMVKRGDITQSSFAFTIAKETRDDQNVRHIVEIGSLLDVSAVSFPASSTTSVFARFAEVEKTTPPMPNFEEKKNTMERRHMTVSDLKAERGQLVDEFNALTSGLENEQRTAHESEKEQLEKLDSDILRIDETLEIRAKQAKHSAQVSKMAHVGTTSHSEARDIAKTSNRFSLSRAIGQVANGRPLMGAELEWSMESHRESRAAGINSQGQIGIPSWALETRGATDDFQATDGASDAGAPGFVPTLVPGSIDALRAPSAIQQLGINVINATGNLQMPRVGTKAGAVVATEVADTTLSGMIIDEVNLTPTRYTTKTIFSKQLMIQGGSAVDSLISRELNEAINYAIDNAVLNTLVHATALTDIAGSTTSGMYNSSAVAMSSAVIFDLESQLIAADADMTNVRFAAGARGFSEIRGLSATGTGGSALYDDGRLAGYFILPSGRVLETSLKDTIYMANWGQAIAAAAFGGLDFLVDPYSKADQAQIVVNVNKFFDADLRQPGAIATSILAVTA